MTDSRVADLISRSAALEVINAVKCVAWSQSGKVLCGKMFSQIKDLPAVEAVPVVHARWRELKDGTEECTNCLGLCPHEENYNGDVIFNFGCEYCPWCGAKMDGERRDSE